MCCNRSISQSKLSIVWVLNQHKSNPTQQSKSDQQSISFVSISIDMLNSIDIITTMNDDWSASINQIPIELSAFFAVSFLLSLLDDGRLKLVRCRDWSSAADATMMRRSCWSARQIRGSSCCSPTSSQCEPRRCSRWTRPWSISASTAAS